jgi:ATP-dependent Clp protease ATP-binding subunit ClpB
MTSNIGSRRILEYSGKPSGAAFEQMEATVMDEVHQHFRPEFLNRIDETVVFHALTEKDLQKIIDVQLQRLLKRLEDRHITLHLTDAAKKHLLAVGYDPSFGARPLKRAIQRELETNLSRNLLAGKIRDGQTVTVDYDADTDSVTFQ